MVKTLVKKCQKPMGKQQKEQNMITVGREMFSNKAPKREIPIISVSGKNVKN